MKVLMLNYEYPPLGGGAANATAYLLKEFSLNPDLRIDLITSSTSTKRVERISDGVTIHFLDIGKQGNLHYQTNRDLLAYSWTAFRYARQLIADAHYDLCHAFFGIPCGFIARKLGLPYIVSLRGSDVPFYNERFRNLDRLFFKRMSVRIWKEARRVVANSEGLRALALQSSPEQAIDVIHNGVDTEAFRPAKHGGKGLRAICVSRLIARKGIEHAIRALDQVRDVDVTLTIVGRGNQEEELRGLVSELSLEDRVTFAGYVDHDSIAGLYQESDVFVLPSMNEGMSNTVLEAMACGLPLLLTDTGGTSELLVDGINGFVVRMRSADDIAERLRRYADDRRLLESHGRESRNLAEKMSWSAAAEAYLDVYKQALT